ncbi:MAG TPA: SulP family inorganic anion transporter [Sediminibacterium sp.]|uniref:SulP family inorganic anion transporter n=1 Tax=Sediminibacterium sp. TaxID=1917865 RepID=UPI0008B887F0|nr:SulP family inorganic anion transporter [Sediminibacterium sp.]OHC86362.1 MAG: hypothetical protein A2472_01980 [Sphingobacteriia bacterium RIFOXYC2_FULL_35_18]OHC89874.1 MAG: hypothetical protein A2546_11225 [Sphingobacteriia bacterium RIFOXYD2_FULL_35_12]HLD54220.1 SulP family inorganic anion transporter [Sediminibacterium sp.]
MKLSTKYFKADMLAGMVVFLVALPLCLGIAVASGAPPFAGIISGVIGGIAVGYMSNSNVSVSGPAAGLIAIILVAITEMGYQTFLSAVVIAGAIQLALGLAKAGGISSYFPTSVIEGMLVAIGIIIIKKEIPHAIGYDLDHQGDYFYYNILDDKSYFSDLIHSFNFAHAGSIIIAIVSIAIIVAFNKVPALKKLKAVPGALVAVVAGILLNELFSMAWNDITIKDEHLVLLPVATSFSEFTSQFTAPSLQGFINVKAWTVGVTIAIVASIETLLCLEAGDKMDPMKRFSSANKELTAQGIGNMLSGFLGGIPMTSVIVRTSANLNAGAKTKLAAIAHGVFLLVAVLVIPGLLNKIPMASLAAILIMIGLKLASIKTFKHMWHNGAQQFIPFMVTVIAVVFTDLLKGVGVGLVVSIYFILKGNMKLAYFFRKEKHHTGETIHIELAQEVSFLNKAAIKQTLAHLPENCTVIIDAAHTVYIDYDVLEMIKDFMNFGSKDKNISVVLKEFKEEYKMQEYASNHVTN